MTHLFLKDLRLNILGAGFQVSSPEFNKTYNTDTTDKITIRCKVERIRKKSNKMCFLLLRDKDISIQALFTENEEWNITRDYIKNTVAKITPETVIDITGCIVKTPFPVETATIQNFELKGFRIMVVSPSEIVPVQIYKPDASLDVRLNNRTLDLRPISSKLKFELQTLFLQNISNYLVSGGFTQIFTPKIMEGAAESGSEVFRFDYFGKSASLAQSPQLHKQMAINSDFGKVFEIAPVFRAESSDSGRHLTQYTSVDIEMEILEHYHEVVILLHNLLLIGFQNLEIFLEKWKKYYPDFKEPILPSDPIILTYQECVRLLEKSEYGCQRPEDINHQDELSLGKLIKQKYNSDLFVIDRYPKHIRPFYTYTEKNATELTRSYDFIFRGCEILSGAQRINNYNDLLESANTYMEGDVSTLTSYLDSFKYGSPPHGGGAFGLERVIARYLNLDNIRETCLFPRDPTRLNP